MKHRITSFQKEINKLNGIRFKIILDFSVNYGDAKKLIIRFIGICVF